jgi:PAS domain S-box-containing protein
MWLSGLLISFVLGCFVMVVLNQIAFLRRRDLCNGLWMGGWVLLSFHFAADLWNHKTGTSLSLYGLKEFLMLMGLSLLTWGTNHLAGKKTPVMTAAAFVVLAVFVAVMGGLGVNPLTIVSRRPEGADLWSVHLLLLPGSVWTIACYLTMAHALRTTRYMAGMTRSLSVAALAAAGLLLPVFRHMGVVPPPTLNDSVVMTSYALQLIPGFFVTLALTAAYIVHSRAQSIQAEQRRQLLQEHATDLLFFFRLGPSPHFEYISPSKVEMGGYSIQELWANPALIWEQIHPDDKALLTDLVAGKFENAPSGVLRWRDRHGEAMWTEYRIVPVRDALGDVLGYEGIVRDVSAQRKVELQLERSRKLEALGRLAGGIAHDFNNLLSVLMGTAEQLVPAVKDDPSAQGLVNRILDVAERSRRLTGQLLVFGRQMPFRPGIVNWNRVVDELAPLLSSIVGKNISTELVTPEDEIWVFGDRSQLDQVVLNLVINARQAMPEGGTLTVKSRLAIPPRPVRSANPHLAEEPHLVFTVQDTGCGIAPEVQELIFDPFYTTKPDGTGLGLSTTYAIVQHMGGAVSVASQPGQGATFDIYLPLAETPPDAGLETDDRRAQEVTTALSGTVLVVDDEPDLLEIIAAQIGNLGLDVCVASSGEEALDLIRQMSSPPDLLLSDVVLPGMSGPALLTQARAVFPDLPALFMSGFPGKVHGVEDMGDTPLLRKPFRKAELAREVRRILEG